MRLRAATTARAGPTRLLKSSGAGSPGTAAEVQYRVDGTANWIDLAITGIGDHADPTAIDIVGDKLSGGRQ